jgi:HSP20 family molecular chaperone IbpA
MSEEKKNIQKRESKNIDQVERARSVKVFAPAVDILEREDHIIVKAEMPGADPDSIDITIDKGVLCITGEVEKMKHEGYEPAYLEYEVGDYRRSFTLGEKVDQSKIQANYNDGVLTLELPKTEEAKPKKIEVKFS